MGIYINRQFFLTTNFFFTFRQSRWPYNRRAFNSQLFRCDKIIMIENDDQINNQFLSLSPNIISWHQITSLKIVQPFNSTYLRVLFSRASNLRTVELHYRSERFYKIDLKEENLIYLLNDASLCNMLMSNGLRQLNLFYPSDQSNLINIAHLIVERLPHLQVLDLTCINSELTEIPPILIKGLSKLNFLIFTGPYSFGEVCDEELRDLKNSNNRPFRTKTLNTIRDDTLFVWF